MMKRAALAVGALVVALLAACSTDTSTTEEPSAQMEGIVTSVDGTGQTILADYLRQDFEREREWMNEFEIAVLEDGIITDLELNEAVSMFHSCLTDFGATGILTIDYTGVGARLTDQSVDAFAEKHGADGGNQVGRALDTCLNQGVSTIGVYYTAHIGNPEGLELDEVFAQCASTVGHPGILNGLTSIEIIELENYPAQWSQLPQEVRDCITDPFTTWNTYGKD